jgi:hypothetical protein
VFGAQPKIPKKPPKKWINNGFDPFNTILLNGSEAIIDPYKSLYYQIVIAWHWLKKISPSSSWYNRLLELIKDCKINPALMGFSENVFDDDFWNN